jgi:hypothetical protein
VWRVVRLVAGGGIVVVLGAAALMLWPLLWPPDPDTTIQLVNGRLVGETSGYVGRVDRDARTVDVSSSLVGWRPVVLVVSEQTAIQVQDRRGDIDDLVKDGPVRVSYELVGDKRLARSIEVVGDDAGRASPVSHDAGRAATPSLAQPRSTVPTPDASRPDSSAGTPRTDVQPATVTRPVPAQPPQRVEPVAPKAPEPSTEKRPAPVAQKPSAPNVEKDERTPVKPPATRTETAPPAPPKAAAPESRPPASASPPATRQEVETPRNPPVARPPESDSGDGAAAIDWLLKRGR